MHIAVSGSSGMVGSTPISSLTREGHRVTRLVRKAANGEDGALDIAQWVKDLPRLESVDAVVHLAGENIAPGQWTAARKETIRRSRLEGTHRLCESLACLSRRPARRLADQADGPAACLRAASSFSGEPMSCQNLPSAR